MTEWMIKIHRELEALGGVNVFIGLAILALSLRHGRHIRKILIEFNGKDKHGK